MKSQLTVTELPPDGPPGYRFEIVLYATDVERLHLDPIDFMLLQECERGGRASDVLCALMTIFSIAQRENNGRISG